MSSLNLRNITNSFHDVQLASLSSLEKANELAPPETGGPYVVLQKGFDPEDPKVLPDEFVLGRSGKWLSLSHFFQMPVPERREEFIFATAAEVMKVMGHLPPKPEILRPSKKVEPAVEPSTPPSPSVPPA